MHDFPPASRRPSRARAGNLTALLLVGLLPVGLLWGCSDSGDDAAPGTPVRGDASDDASGGDGSSATDPVPEPSPDPDAAAALPEPLIDIDTAAPLVEEAFAIFSGEAWDTAPLSLPTALNGISGVFEPAADAVTELPDGRFAIVLASNCLAGDGRLEAGIPSGIGNVPWRTRLNACALDPGRTGLELIDGSVEGEWNWHVSARSDALRWITAAGEHVSFSGEMRDIPSGQRSEDVTSFVTDGARQVVRDGIDAHVRRSVEAATSRRSLGTVSSAVDVASVSGGFAFRGELTGGLLVTVRTPVELAYRWDVRTPAPDGVPPDGLGEPPLGDVLAGEVRTEAQHAAADRLRRRWAFTAGSLELEAEDGSRLTLEADTGELDTVRLTLDAGRGDGAREHLLDWPDGWYRALAPGNRLPSDRAERARRAQRR